VIMALHVFALVLGVFAAMSALAFFLVGVLPGRSAPWWKQYGWAAVAFVAAYLLITYAFTGDPARYLLD